VDDGVVEQRRTLSVMPRRGFASSAERDGGEYCPEQNFVCEQATLVLA